MSCLGISWHITDTFFLSSSQCTDDLQYESLELLRSMDLKE